MFCYFYKEIDEEVLRMQTDEIVGRARLLDNEIKVRFFMSTLVTLWSYDILPKLSTIPKTLDCLYIVMLDNKVEFCDTSVKKIIKLVLGNYSVSHVLHCIIFSFTDNEK